MDLLLFQEAVLEQTPKKSEAGLRRFFEYTSTDLVQEDHALFGHYKLLLFFVHEEFDQKWTMKALDHIRQEDDGVFLQRLLHTDVDLLYEDVSDSRQSTLLSVCVRYRWFRLARFIIEDCDMQNPLQTDSWSFDPITLMVIKMEDISGYFGYEVSDFQQALQECLSFLRFFLAYHPVDIYEFKGDDDMHMSLPLVFRLMVTGNIPLVQLFHDLYNIDFLRPFECEWFDLTIHSFVNKPVSAFEYALIKTFRHNTFLRYIDAQVHATGGTAIPLERILPICMSSRNAYVFRQLVEKNAACLLTQTLDNGRTVFVAFDLWVRKHMYFADDSFNSQILMAYTAEFSRMDPEQYIRMHNIESPLMTCVRYKNSTVLQWLISENWFDIKCPQFQQEIRKKPSYLLGTMSLAKETANVKAFEEEKLRDAKRCRKM